MTELTDFETPDAEQLRQAVRLLAQQVRLNQTPIDKPIAIGRNNGLFAGSLRAGQHTAAVMSLV